MTPFDTRLAEACAGSWAVEGASAPRGYDMKFLRTIFLLILLALLPGVVAASIADPPGRVARLALAEGMVLLFDRYANEWNEVGVNWPLTGGDALYTGPDGRAEFRIGSGAVRMDAGTEIELSRLDDEQIRMRLEYGSLAIRIRSHDPADWMTIETPDGRVLATEPGQYRVDRLDGRTAVTVHRGAAEFFAEDSRMAVREGQRIEVLPGVRTAYRQTGARSDSFSDWYLARDARDDAIGAPRFVSPEMTGAEDLARHGDWSHYADYGPVWTPRSVPAGWVPYRYGQWIWVRPWGWTWVDEAPWGFAPFHYGRWAMVRGRWAWIPGNYVARPVYAPALVAWIGSSGWSIGFSFGSVPAYGWFPLGPREVYVPYYRASPVYVRQINIVHVHHVHHITRVIEQPRREWRNYRNHRHALTAVPSDTLQHRRPVHRAMLRDAERWTRDAHVSGEAPRFMSAVADTTTASERRQWSRRVEQDRERRGTRSQAPRPEQTRTPRRDAGSSAQDLSEPIRIDAGRSRPSTALEHRDRRSLPAARGDRRDAEARRPVTVQRSESPAGRDVSVRTPVRRAEQDAVPVRAPSGSSEEIRTRTGDPSLRMRSVERRQDFVPRVSGSEGEARRQAIRPRTAESVRGTTETPSRATRAGVRAGSRDGGAVVVREPPRRTQVRETPPVREASGWDRGRDDSSRERGERGGARDGFRDRRQSGS